VHCTQALSRIQGPIIECVFFRSAKKDIHVLVVALGLSTSRLPFYNFCLGLYIDLSCLGVESRLVNFMARNGIYKGFPEKSVHVYKLNYI
jgi:hypothetical protein